MLADLVDHVIGVDPAKRVFTAVIVDSSTAGEQAHREFTTTQAGYLAAIEWAQEHDTTVDGRVWAIEGAGSYGSGLAQMLGRAGEWVIEFGHPKSRASPDGTKNDRLDALRAARESLSRDKWPVPRARGEREGLRALTVARDGAIKSRTRAINELKNLLITAPIELRDQLRGLTTAQLIAKCAQLRPGAHQNDAEMAGTKTAMRSLARRVKELAAEADHLQTQMKPLITKIAPGLCNEFGVGTICAARVIIAWSHKGRFASEHAFSRFAGVSPIEATTGGADIVRHRLNLAGDRGLNNALHIISLARISRHPETQAFMTQKKKEGKSRREARRILKRYIARRLFRLLENQTT